MIVWITDAEFDALIFAGRHVLEVFLRMSGARVMMSALYVGRLHDLGHSSTLLVGGSLGVGRQPVFGRSATAAPFSKTDLDWGGHAWVRFGEYLPDVSLVQTAYAAEAQRLLARHVTRSRPRAMDEFARKAAAERLAYTRYYSTFSPQKHRRDYSLFQPGGEAYPFSAIGHLEDECCEAPTNTGSLPTASSLSEKRP